MTTEKLHITNFAGIAEADIEIAQMNIFIGPQASGKSIIAKLLHYFKEFPRRIINGVAAEHLKSQIEARDKRVFLSLFPASTWAKGSFLIDYSVDDYAIKIVRSSPDSETITIHYSKRYDSIMSSARRFMRLDKRTRMATAGGDSDVEGFEEKTKTPAAKVKEAIYIGLLRLTQEAMPLFMNVNLFIPAGRSFFAVIGRNALEIINEDVKVDPLLVQFAFNYSRMLESQESKSAKYKKAMDSILCGSHARLKGREFIQTQDGRSIPIEKSSSGQQEALPLITTLADIVSQKHNDKALGTTLIVEEPEAHLYPDAQRGIVRLLSQIIGIEDDTLGNQCIITTHSPYILSSLNNLMYAGQVIRIQPEKSGAVQKAIEEATPIDSQQVQAYFVSGGRCRAIMDRDTGLIQASALDEVSNTIAAEFEKLIDIAFGE